MSLKTINVKQLRQIEQLSKQLLLTLGELDFVDQDLCHDLTALAIEARNELQLRAKMDTMKRIQETNNKLNTWENEGGNTADVIR